MSDQTRMGLLHLDTNTLIERLLMWKRDAEEQYARAEAADARVDAYKTAIYHVYTLLGMILSDPVKIDIGLLDQAFAIVKMAREGGE